MYDDVCTCKRRSSVGGWGQPTTVKILKRCNYCANRHMRSIIKSARRPIRLRLSKRKKILLRNERRRLKQLYKKQKRGSRA